MLRLKFMLSKRDLPFAPCQGQVFTSTDSCQNALNSKSFVGIQLCDFLYRPTKTRDLTLIGNKYSNGNKHVIGKKPIQICKFNDGLFVVLKFVSSKFIADKIFLGFVVYHSSGGWMISRIIQYSEMAQ